MVKCLEILGIIFGVIGLIAAIVACVLPIWRVRVFTGSNIITAQVVWEGLWMNCVIHSTGQMQCKIYESMLALPQDMQAARALTVISIILGILGVLISIVGAKCMKWGAAKAKVMIISGIFFILAGILILIPVCWVAHNIIQDSHNLLWLYVQRREIGASLYIGWPSAALFLIGGVLLCSRCPPNEKYISLQMVYTEADGGHNNRDNVSTAPK